MKSKSENCKYIDTLVTKSVAMKQVYSRLERFAQHDVPLVLQGETGSGKDRLAKICHQMSDRSQSRFLAINCAGLPADEAEQEMFGYSANGKENTGFFEDADGGTLLLDSINELSLPLQAKLLRLLHDGSFRRVGDSAEHYVSVRIICTSQLPLVTYVERGELREDLFHRLNVFSLVVPPLRQRKEDIEPLTALFLNEIGRQLNHQTFTLAEGVLDELKQYSWPGNVRELYNMLLQAATLATGSEIQLSQLNLPSQKAVKSLGSKFNFEEGLTLDEMMAQVEEKILRHYYHDYPSSRKLASRLGLSHTAIANKLRSYNIH